MDKKVYVKVISKDEDEVDKIYDDAVDKITKISKDIYNYLAENYKDIEVLELMLLGVSFLERSVNAIFTEDVAKKFSLSMHDILEELFDGDENE